MGKEILYSEDELKKHFVFHSALKKRAYEIAELCTNISYREEITDMTLDDKCATIGIGVWSQDCGCDSYEIPIEYFSMTTEEIKKAEQKKKIRETRAYLMELKRQKKAEEAAERREYARLKKKYG